MRLVIKETGKYLPLITRRFLVFDKRSKTTFVLLCNSLWCETFQQCLHVSLILFRVSEHFADPFCKSLSISGWHNTPHSAQLYWLAYPRHVGGYHGGSTGTRTTHHQP